MVVNDTPDNRQSEARSLLTFRREEWFEDPREVFLRDSNSGVGHAQFDILLLPSGFDGVPSLPTAFSSYACFVGPLGGHVE